VTRWLSSNIGEGLILDLRTAVFITCSGCPSPLHPQTNRRLVSRLGNDVTGAQRAFSGHVLRIITTSSP